MKINVIQMAPNTMHCAVTVDGQCNHHGEFTVENIEDNEGQTSQVAFCDQCGEPRNDIWFEEN